MLGALRLKWRVVLGVGLVQFATLVAAGLILVTNARQAVEVEVSASEASARALIVTTVGAVVNEMEPGAIVGALEDRLVQPRHVRLDLYDARSGETRPVRESARAERATAPEWFTRVVTPRVRETRLPVVADGLTYGLVLMTTAPQDEIAEVWSDVRALLGVGAASFVASLLLVALIVTRTLRPLAAIGNALAALERGERTLRIAGVRGPDLGPIVARLNALTDALRQSEADRTALNRKIVEVGDAERKSIAMELHDEFGPCLFGLKVKAAAISRTAEGAGQEALRRDAGEVLSIAEQIQTANARLLTTLRPMAIGQLPLRDAIEDLLAGFRGRHPSVAWTVDLPPSLPATDETLDLTAYRVVQEGVTNALRHGTPRRVRIAIDMAVPGFLRLVVEDDGRGMPEGMAPGRGISGMRDRILASGGTLGIGPGADGGTRLEARLPLPDAGAAVRAAS